MAVKSSHAPHQSETDAEVSSCVANLIQAFTNGLNIFKRLRERRKKRKARKETQVPEATTSVEQQLSRSLRKGPEELAERYAECYHGGMGQHFAKGDAIAHASLAETLIKLNTGLVGIIATFLNYDHKNAKGRLILDYTSLTALSDTSRKEALQSMTQLYQRLSYSQLQLHHFKTPACSRCGSSTHIECSGRNLSTDKGKKTHTSSRQRVNGAVVTRMPIKSSSQPQLVVVRPKNMRKASNSSNTSNSIMSPPTSTCVSPMPSPLPKYVVMDPFEMHSTRETVTPVPPPAKRRVDSFDDPRPSTWPYDHKPTDAPHTHHPTPQLPTFTPAPRRLAPYENRVPAFPYVAPSASPPFKRRIDKLTPSSYTFASDSTKLGEIPQRHWTKPWDYEEAERLNEQAAGMAAAVVPVGEGKMGKKKGLFRFLKRGGQAGVVS